MESKMNGRPAHVNTSQENYCILLLDEDKHSRLLHQHHFGKKGCELTTVKSIFGLLRQLLSKSFDLVILEVHLKGRNYYSLIGCVKTLSKQAPLVVQSSQGLPEDRQKCFEQGCDLYFLKPLSWPIYLAGVLELLGQLGRRRRQRRRRR